MLLVNEMNREYSLTGAFAHRDYMQYLLRLFLIRVQRSGERKDYVHVIYKLLRQNQM